MGSIEENDGFERKKPGATNLQYKHDYRVFLDLQLNAFYKTKRTQVC